MDILNGASLNMQDMMRLSSMEEESTRELSSVEKRNGIMGVPITFMDRFSPEQFEIIGATESEGKGFSNGLWNESSGIAQPVVNGQRKYKRLFVRQLPARRFE